MLDLAREAHELGARIAFAYLPAPILGHCDVDRGEILVDLRLTEVERKAVLAHELAHYRAGHPCSTSTYEARADRRAARMLVALDDYRAAAAIYPGDPAAIADELGVTKRIVRLFEKQLPPLLRGA
jgi:hypothetical protein